MIKYFCDWCKKECSDLIEISIAKEEEFYITNRGEIITSLKTGKYYSKKEEICPECARKLNDIIATLKN